MRRYIILALIALINITLFAKTHVICVGIDKYQNETIKDNWHCEEDAKKMTSFFLKGKADVKLLTGPRATKEAILNAIRQKLIKVSPDDKIILFFSGHGYEGGFVPYDATLYDNYLSYDEIVNELQESKAENKYIFANACFSGGIGNEKNFSKKQKGNVLFFLAARGDESSWENSLMTNTYFTHYLLQALRGAADINKDKNITAKELFNYVSREVKKATDNIQHPVMWGNFPDDMIIVSYK